MKKFINNWLSNHGKFSKNNPDLPKVMFINFLHIVYCLTLIIYGLYNVVISKDLDFAISHFLFIIPGIALIAYFKISNDLKITSYLSFGLMLVVMSYFIIVAPHSHYVLMWIILMPIMTYFLLKNKYIGLIAFVYLVVLSLVFHLNTTDNNDLFDFLGVLTNALGATLVLSIAFWHYRKLEYQQQNNLIALNAHLKNLSERDKLTTLYNRLKIDELLEKAIENAYQNSEPLCLMMIDIDDFKKINDTFGHLEGDVVLMRASQILRNNILDKMKIGRWGGEEFLIICPDTTLEVAQTVAKKLEQTIAEHIFNDNIHFTISVGVAVFEQSDDLESLIKKADIAMYQIKNATKNHHSRDKLNNRN